MPNEAATIQTRNLVAFWILGLCNNFAYVIMLSAAKDILEVENRHNQSSIDTDCIRNLSTVICSPISTGSVLLADILPTLFVKLIAPFALHSVPYSIRHTMVLFFQTSSFIIVALSESIPVGIIGVVFASLGAGLGEISYLSLASNFHRDVISSWSSGTGGSGIFGALIYAMLTDPSFLGMSPRNALFSMLIIPVIFGITYLKILRSPPTVHKVILLRPSTYLIPDRRDRRDSSTSDLQQPLIHDDSVEDQDDTASTTSREHMKYSICEKLRLTKSLYKFMVPLSLVYFGEYFINQGLVELLVFDCTHGLNLNRLSQYRWYQVLYQFGVFISRSSSKIAPIKHKFLPFLAILQLMNASLFFEDSINRFIPHILIVFAIILYEGLLGGAAYVNTFNAVHKMIPIKDREFSMGFVSLADSFGIVIAGFLAIPTHNFIFFAKSTNGTCPSDSIQGLTQNTCYSFSQFLDTWDEAQQYCQKQGGNLVTIPDAVTNNFLLNATQYKYIWGYEGYFWIGLTNSGDNWSWVDGSNLGYTNWDAGQPNSQEFNPKGGLYVQTQGTWFSLDGTNNHAPFICQYKNT